MKSAYQSLMEAVEIRKDKLIWISFGYWNDWHSPDEDAPEPVPEVEKVYTWEEGQKFLHHWSAESGFGSPEAYPFYAWGINYVYLISDYDGAVEVRAVSRYPVTEKPEFF